MAKGARIYGIGVDLKNGRSLTNDEPIFFEATSTVGARRKAVELAWFFWWEISKFDEADFFLLVTKKKGTDARLVASTVRGQRFNATNETDVHEIPPTKKPKPKLIYVASVSTDGRAPDALRITASSYTEARFEVFKEANDLHDQFPKSRMSFFLRNQTLPFGSTESAVSALLSQPMPPKRTKENIVNVDPTKSGRDAFEFPGKFRPQWVLPLSVQKLKDQLADVRAAVAVLK